MGVKQGLTLAVILGISASGALAQPAAEPPLLKLPMGARVRLQPLAAPGDWMKGILVSADSTSVAIVPEDAPPLGNNQLVVPSASIARFELATGRKRHWLKGLISGVALGLVVGFTEEVDSSTCNDPYSYFGSSSDRLLLQPRRGCRRVGPGVWGAGSGHRGPGQDRQVDARGPRRARVASTACERDGSAPAPAPERWRRGRCRDRILSPGRLAC